MTALPFTVFTPTYNRAHTLHRVYESLQAQGFRDFEWVVIDDGSADGTADLVRGWVAQAHFPIRYFWQENQGKHIAHNRACIEAHGSMMHIVDSDDALMPNTLERFWFHWQSVAETLRARYSGVTALCQDQTGRLVSPRFPQSPLDVTGPDLRYRHHMMGEFCGCSRVDVLRAFPFPETKGLHFISESYVWDQIGRRYLAHCVNEVLRVYYQDEQPQGGAATSLTRHAPQRNARSEIPFYESAVNHDNAYFWHAPKLFVQYAALYVRFCQHIRVPLATQWRQMQNWRAKMIWLLALPLGLSVYWRDRMVAVKPNPTP